MKIKFLLLYLFLFCMPLLHAQLPLNGTWAYTLKTIALNRVWNKGDKISISFTMPVKMLDGGISYPGTVAFQRGPQILVVDKSLNPDLPDDFSVQPGSSQLQGNNGRITR